MIQRFLNKKAKTATIAAGLLSISALLSEFLAVFRNNLLATSFTNIQTDVYFAAFRIPDFVYGILITGGIVAAFLPVFSESMRDKSKDQAKELTANVINVFLMALVSVSFVLFLFAPKLVKLVVPGFSVADQATTAYLMRIMFLSPILLGMSAILSGVLHYFNLFFAYALAPVLYNIGIIIGILFFYPLFGLAGLAWGVILGAFMHLAIQIPSFIKQGFRARFTLNLKLQGLKKIFKLMLPRTISSAAYYINFIIITAIASTISIGAISIFNYSNYLYGAPVALIGIPFATAIFPVLSRNFALKQKEKFSHNFSSTFRKIVFFAVPASFLLFVFRFDIVRLIYGTVLTGKNYFQETEIMLTAGSLGIFALSLFAVCLIPFLARVFFALHNTKTPVKIAVVSILANIVLAYSFVWAFSFSNFFQNGFIKFLGIEPVEGLSVLGLPLALTISSLIQVILLMLFLKIKTKMLAFRLIALNFLKVFIASMVMTLFAMLSLMFFRDIKGMTSISSFAPAFFACLLAILVYILSAFLLRIESLRIGYRIKTKSTTNSLEKEAKPES